MKEATGELNMTVIAVVAIAAVGAFFYAVIWPNIKGSINRNTQCADAICSKCTVSDGKRKCTDCTDSAGKTIDGTCVYNSGDTSNK